MHFQSPLLIVAALLLLMGCATVPPPPRESPDVSVIGVGVSIAAPLWGHRQAQFVYFIRLDDADLDFRGHPIQSNYNRGKYVYLFNAQPGHYAVVSAGFMEDSQPVTSGTSSSVGGGFSVGSSVSMSLHRTINAYLPKTLIERSIVTVGPGETVFIGEIVLNKAKWESADEIQRHHYKAMAPGHEDLGLFAKRLKGWHDPGTEKTLDQSEAARSRFLKHFQKFATADWANSPLSAVGSRPPAR
jgi:hypothetical protein